MKYLLILLGAFLALTVSAQKSPNPPSDYARDWRRADSLAANGLPKSAMAIATQIYKDAKTTQNYPQVAKAAIYRMIFRSYSDENAYVELIRSIQADIRHTPEPARSVLQSVLADIYWQYFQQNRYKFYDRATTDRATIGRTSGTAEPADTTDDFRNWDARHLIGAITAAYRASVHERTVLQNTPIATFDALIDKGDAGTRPLRPTLYDLLAHRAIGFFQNTEPDLLKPIFTFELNTADYLAEPAVFIKAVIQSRDSLSGRYQALLLYQQLLALHITDRQPDALADVDVLRLAFVYQHSVVPNKDSLYRKTLEKQTTQFKNHPAEAVYGYQLAEFLANHGENAQPIDDDDLLSEPSGPGPLHWNRKQAADICRMVKRYPETLAGRKASLLLTQLLQPTYSVQCEAVTMPKQPFRALVTYQNVPKILYRIVPVPTVEMQTSLYRNNTEDDWKKLLATWLKRPKVAENTLKLPDDGDLNQHSVEVPLTGLPIGHYLLLATTDDTFQEKPDLVQYSFFTVSTLGYLTPPNNNNDSIQMVFVMNRLTGEPIKNASLEMIDVDNMISNGRKKFPLTNADGQIKLIEGDMPIQHRFYYRIIFGTDTLLSNQQNYYDYGRDQDKEKPRTYIKLFTDRAIYRPGQLIYVKGLLYEGKANQYTVIANQELSIYLRDQNRQQLANQTLTTNEFGTFTASFTAPVGRLTGQMTLQTEYGSVNIRVEEYKRPTFEVKIKPIRESFKLGQTVVLRAETRTFSGAFVDDAAVRYRVVRKLHQRWYWWYRPWNGGSRNANQTEIAIGKDQTDAQGNVMIAFMASPDLEKARKDNPVFDFEITIDVTDRAGETRSTTQTLQIGYSALQAKLAIPTQIEKDVPASFPIKITNQSGENVSAKGQLSVYKLQPPTHPLRNRLWNRPDRQFISRAEFERLFPDDLYANETDPRSWPKGPVVQQQTINSPIDSLFKPDLSQYAAGEYLAELTVTDSLGETTREQAFFVLVDEKHPIASARPDGWLQVRKTMAEPGEKAIFWVGNGLPSWVLMTVEENRTIVRQEWIKTNGSPKQVTLPVTEKQRGGFAVHFAMIQNGRLYQQSQLITVPFTNKQLRIETTTFRNKLKPGEREEWTLKISGLDKNPAELVATLYDASLDVFDRLNWSNDFYQTYSPFFNGWQSGSFTALTSNALFYRNRPFYRPRPQPSVVPARQYDQLGWMGYRFSLYGSRPFRHSPIGPFGVSDDALRVSVHREGKTITGTVKDVTGVAMPRVSIAIKGTTKGATTNAKGQFSLSLTSVNEPITLVFAYIGYVTKEVTIQQKALSFKLLADAQALNEVVVVGYGTQQRRDVTGSVATVARKAMPASSMNYESYHLGRTYSKAPDNEPKNQPDLINPRRNFNETAFFLPQLRTDEQGRVVLKFTMPEALTRWRLLAFAHTKDLKTGMLERTIVTQKDLMITANAPRFLREGDTIRVAARVNNMTDKAMPIVASLTLSDALTGEPLNQKLALSSLQTSVTVAAGLGQAVGWTLVVPSGFGLVTCRLTAQSGNFTDGEEFTIPVLANRMLVTDTQPFWVNGTGSHSAVTKEFKLKELVNLNPELPAQHERLTVEVTSNPTWYALQSLPYLMEYRYECAEQLFSRLYANSLAAHIVTSKPAFQQVIAQWQKVLPRSPLQSNEELKAVALENSPWLAQARSETDRQAKLGQLLDQNRMTNEQGLAFEKLQKLQTASGGFSWFGGMMPDLPMTLHILSGFGHLQKLGVQLPDAIQAQWKVMQTNAIRYADAEMKQWIDEQTNKKEIKGWYFSATQYLYARSFYRDIPIDKPMLAFLKQRVVNDWQAQSLQGQALTALALHRFGDTKTPDDILRSLRERTRESEEMGIYWPDNQSGLNWYQTPIETQAYLIEAFDEIRQDRETVDNMKRWLLRQKQTQSWSSTKATTEAVYALLLRGSDWLDTKPNTLVQLGGQSIENHVTQTEQITGYEKATYSASEIKPAMGVIQITKTGEGPAWGALYWQHFEPLDRVMPGSSGLSIRKALFVQRDTLGGSIFVPVTPQTVLKPGDLINVWLSLKTDRVMEYVHLKDGRASGFEPIAVLSGYKYKSGLGYYESPRDASTDFFFNYLPVGTHVFGYELRVAQTGDFSTGVATVQCFYAPEFSAHSAGGRVRVK